MGAPRGMCDAGVDAARTTGTGRDALRPTAGDDARSWRMGWEEAVTWRAESSELLVYCLDLPKGFGAAHGRQFDGGQATDGGEIYGLAEEDFVFRWCYCQHALFRLVSVYGDERRRA